MGALTAYLISWVLTIILLPKPLAMDNPFPDYWEDCPVKRKHLVLCVVTGAIPIVNFFTVALGVCLWLIMGICACYQWRAVFKTNWGDEPLFKRKD